MRAAVEARLTELQQEMNTILTAFPDLRPSRRGRAAKPAGQDKAQGVAKRGRKPMTAVQKKAVGLRMKKYWAERRKREGKA